MSSVKPIIRFASIIVFLFFAFSPLRMPGQSRQSGEIRGTVIDESQAAIPGVTVTITNVLTDVSQKLTTDVTGVYEAPFVQPGEYSITFAKDGFRTYVRKGIVLHVETIKVDATLTVGMVTESVSVTASAPLVQTENAEKSLTLTQQIVLDSPNVGRSWDYLLGLVPGVSGGGNEQATGQGIGVNGQQSYQSNWQIDGGVAMLGASQNPDILQPPLETIEELDFNTANFGADHGNGLSVFNVTTKSGTNRFHGDVFEFVENDKLNARNFFDEAIPNYPLRWNEYGFNLGGPIKKDKLFFFGSFQNNPNISNSPSYYTFPTDDIKNGNFSAFLGGPVLDNNGNPVISPCTNQPILQGQLYDPSTTTTVNGNVCRSPIPGNIITGQMDKVALNIQKYFPEPLLSSTGDDIYNNYPFEASYNVFTKWVNGKIDYNLSPAHRLAGSFMLVHNNTVVGDPICDVECSGWHQYDIQGQITDIWTVSAAKINELRFSFTREHGVGVEQSFGKGFPAQLGLANPAGDLFPQVSIEGVFSTGIGWSAYPPALDVENTFAPSDVFTWVKGKHILKFGGEFDRWDVNSAWPSANEGAFDFAGDFTTNLADLTIPNVSGATPVSQGEGYADFLLGLPDYWYIYIAPETGARMWSFQSFAQDEYKIKPNLTLTFGLRYVSQSGWSEVHNEISSFQPNIVNPDTGTLGALWFAGQNGHTAATNTVWDFFDPRLGFAWSPRKNWAVRGGYGIYNVIEGMNIYAGGGFGQGWTPTGYLQTTDEVTPIFQLSSGPPAPIYPGASSRTADLLNGQGVNYSPWATPVGYSEEYSLGVQHELPGAVAIDISYVGNRGVHLPFPRDIDQVPLSDLGPGDMQLNRPYPQYDGITAALMDGISNYNALQVSAKKQMFHGIVFTTNYTWSRAMDTLTGIGLPGGARKDRVGYQNAYDPRANYGPSGTDIRQMLNGNFVYQLPFGQKKRFLNKGGVGNTVFGGWEVSSVFQLHTGIPYSPTWGGLNTSNSLAGSLRPNRIGSGALAHPNINNWFDTTAFTAPVAYTFGNSGRDFLYGPNWHDMDLAILKNFSVKRLGEQSRLQVKAEAYNVFNHPNFGLPNASIESAGVGTISSAFGARTLQLGAKFSF